MACRLLITKSKANLLVIECKNPNSRKVGLFEALTVLSTINTSPRFHNNTGILFSLIEDLADLWQGF